MLDHYGDRATSIDSTSRITWLLNFNSEYELGKFEMTLHDCWEALYQVREVDKERNVMFLVSIILQHCTFTYLRRDGRNIIRHSNLLRYCNIVRHCSV